jgi:hypothetical protein
MAFESFRGVKTDTNHFLVVGGVTERHRHSEWRDFISRI